MTLNKPRPTDDVLRRHSPLERAQFVARQKQIYEHRYPETKHGANLSIPKSQRKQATAERPPSFVAFVAASTSWSRRTIQRAARIGNRIDQTLQEQLALTPIATRTRDLERIADMDADEQQDLLQRLQDAERPPVSLAALTTDPYRPSSPPKTSLDKLRGIWAKTSTSNRRQFLEDILTAASEADRKQFREWLTDQEASS